MWETLKHRRFYIRRGLGIIKFDIALLVMEDPVDFSKYPHIRPLCLPHTEDLAVDLTDRVSTAVGWGLQTVIYRKTSCGYTTGISQPSHLPNKLKKIELRWKAVIYVLCILPRLLHTESFRGYGRIYLA